MSETAICVEGLGKRYCLGARQTYRTFRDSIAHAFTAPFRRLAGRALPKEEPPLIWAVDDVSFEVKRGEVVGIVGRNGAGKSTLLKILSRITEPTRGYAEIHGRVGSLLEVGTGFHPELTGRENVYLNGAILGMKKADVERRFDEIVAFAEMDKFIDTPVKHYSSGMYLRLAFAVAAQLEPEVLLIDEVLAVGDAGFQEKCLGKVRDVARSGRTVLFVSHSMSAIRSLTDRSVWLQNGAVRADGPTPSVVLEYLSAFAGHTQRELVGVETCRRDRYSRSPVQFLRVSVNDSLDCTPVLDIGESFTLALEFETNIEVRGGCIDFELKKTDGTRVTHVLSLDAGFKVFALKGRHTISCVVSDLALTPGQYVADIGIAESTTPKAWDVLLNYPLFSVTDKNHLLLEWPDRPWGAVHCRRLGWSLVSADAVVSVCR